MATNISIFSLIPSIFFLIFNTSRHDQIEKKSRFLCMCSAISMLLRSHFLALIPSFQSLSFAISVTLHGEVTEITLLFDAECTVI